MSVTGEVQSGLEGVVAFATEIAEPDREGGALRYRGVDIEDLVGSVPFEQVWGLLVDGHLTPGLPPAEPHPLSVHSGNPRVDVQAALAMLGPQWGFREVIDITDEEARDNLARASVMALSFVAQSARGGSGGRPFPRRASTRPARSPSASCCAGAARPTRATSRRSTPTGSPPPSTG
jgi:citrate synthase